jgi:uncharacterized damage-inducible protein DinB
MQEFFMAYYERLQTLHSEIARAISGLPLAALDWQPGPGMNSLSVLVAHTAGAERYWIGDVVGQDPSERVRSEEFETQGRSAPELQKLLDSTLAHSYNVIQTLSLDNLEEARQSSRDDTSYSVAWALAHALEHTAIHLGHIQIGRQLWHLQAAGSG